MTRETSGQPASRAAASAGAGVGDHRQAWLRLTLALGGLGLAGFFAVFFWGLSFTPAAQPAGRRIAVPPLSPGQFAYLADPTQGPAGATEFLAVRQADGRLQMWRVPAGRSGPRLPGDSWDRPSWPCSDFSPDFAAGEFRCKDPNLPDWVRKSHRWTLDGHGVDASLPDMPAVAGGEADGSFVLDAPPTR